MPSVSFTSRALVEKLPLMSHACADARIERFMLSPDNVWSFWFNDRFQQVKEDMSPRAASDLRAHIAEHGAITYQSCWRLSLAPTARGEALVAEPAKPRALAPAGEPLLEVLEQRLASGACGVLLGAPAHTKDAIFAHLMETPLATSSARLLFDVDASKDAPDALELELGQLSATSARRQLRHREVVFCEDLLELHAQGVDPSALPARVLWGKLDHYALADALLYASVGGMAARFRSAGFTIAIIDSTRGPRALTHVLWRSEGGWSESKLTSDSFINALELLDADDLTEFNALESSKRARLPEREANTRDVDAPATQQIMVSPEDLNADDFSLEDIFADATSNDQVALADDAPRRLPEASGSAQLTTTLLLELLRKPSQELSAPDSIEALADIDSLGAGEEHTQAWIGETVSESAPEESTSNGTAALLPSLPVAPSASAASASLSDILLKLSER